MAAPFETDKLIRFHHCDPAGIVFYPQYFVLFNELVEDWFNQGLHVDFADFHAVQRLGVPMAHIECDFLAPSKIGETLSLALAVKRIGRTSGTGQSFILHLGQLRSSASGAGSLCPHPFRRHTCS